jgi:Amt family ammonium transporter
MMKNVVDVVLGGNTYWAFGYGMSYGTDAGTSWFVGWALSLWMSFATTATAIVSGAIEIAL